MSARTPSPRRAIAAVAIVDECRYGDLLATTARLPGRTARATTQPTAPETALSPHWRATSSRWLVAARRSGGCIPSLGPENSEKPCARSAVPQTEAPSASAPRLCLLYTSDAADDLTRVDLA